MVTGTTTMRRNSSLLLLLVLLAACGDIVGTTQRPAQTAPAPTRTIVAPTQTPRPTTAQAPDVRRFPKLATAFVAIIRRYWEQRGGLSTFGFPVTAPLFVDGVTTQYFERARFEVRDGQPVALGRVGAEGLLATGRPDRGCHTQSRLPILRGNRSQSVRTCARALA